MARTYNLVGTGDEDRNIEYVQEVVHDLMPVEAMTESESTIAMATLAYLMEVADLVIYAHEKED